MFSKLALRNVRRQIGNYLIYFITVSLTVSFMFAVNNIIFGAEIARYTERFPEFRGGLIGVVVFISLIVAFVLSYATAFMLKLRKREFGTYLTLGMSRKNILSIFIIETMMICIVALGLGLFLGLFIYQGLTAVMMNLMEMEFAISAYSLKGLIFTVVLVMGLFILSSIASAFYLKKVSIYDLIHGDKMVEKKIRYPFVWFLITLVSFIVMTGSIIVFNHKTEEIIKYGAAGEDIYIPVLVFAASLIMFHIGMARSAVFMLLQNKKICSRGTNIFVLRQLSGTLESNSVMIGLLAFLLTFAVIGSNVSFVMRAGEREALNRAYPYDVLYRDELNENAEYQGRLSVSDAEGVIEQYAAIEGKIPYCIYDSGSSDLHAYTKWHGDGYEGLTDSFMSESDFNAITVPLGYAPVKLENEFLIIANTTAEVGQIDWAAAQFMWNGKTYRCKGVSDGYPMFSYMYFYAVVPDEAVASMTECIRYIAYDLKDGKYDAAALKKQLSYSATETYRGEEHTYEICDFSLRELGRQDHNSTNAILVIGALFIASVFLFMAMAILALKTLSGLSDDRSRYQILFRLGTDARQQSKALFAQTFSFFLMPFAVALVMSIPTVLICTNIYEMNGVAEMSDQIFVISGAIALVMALIYAIYYLATYLIAKRSVVCFEA